MVSETSGRLRRVLGVGFGLAVSIGGTVGVGILRTPGLVAGDVIRFLAVLILVSIVALQWLGVRISSQFQEVTTSMKCIAFLALIAACLLVPTSGHVLAHIPSPMTLSGLMVALQAVVITYAGWQSPLYF